jgi:hypothetical protein
MFDPQDASRYMNEIDFIPHLLGLGPIEPGAVRVVLAPSFHPEETWDVQADGTICVIQAKESIWQSIPHRVRNQEDKDWAYRTYAAFAPGKVVAFHLARTPVAPESLISSVDSYNHPKGISADGIGTIYIHVRDGVIVSQRIHNPIQSALLDCLRKILDCLKTCGYRSEIESYLPLE